jgi:hypothetical protein
MRKDLVISLTKKAQEIADNFSNKERPNNQNKEVFIVAGIKPLSETTAEITFMKNTGKLAIAFAYHINMNGGEWKYFFPTESHIIGMQRMSACLYTIDEHNFKQNGC